MPDRLLYDCQPTALKRAFTNLIENGVKYADHVFVRLENVDGGLVVRVEDDGPGIPTDELERIFTPFYRVERSRNPETGSVGLGLAVAQTVVHAHGGEIRATNRTEGGLCVTVELPR